MIFSKANLACYEVAAPESEYMKGLSGVKFEKDGTTVATNGKIIMAVSPANPKRANFPADACNQIDPPRGGILIPTGLIVRVLKTLSKVKQLPLMHVAMGRGKDIHRVGFTSVNESGDPTTIAAIPMTDSYPNWRMILAKLMGQTVHRVVVNRDDLVKLLRAMDSACPSHGNISPIYMEVGPGGIVIHGRNYDTQQSAIAGLTSIDTKGAWIEGEYDWKVAVAIGPNAGEAKSPEKHGSFSPKKKKVNRIKGFKRKTWEE